MANIKITDLAAIADPISTDVLPIVDVSADITNKISIEDLLKSAADGTAAAPAFAFDSDPDTGAYRTGANGLGFSTGGTGRLFIDSSGNVGVGTSSPAQLLHLKGSYPRAWLEPSADTESAYYAFGNTSGSQRGYVAYDFNTENMFFRTNGSERVRIDGQGRLGVGTSSPATKLEVEEGTVQVKNTSTASLGALLNYGITFGGTNQVGQYRGTIAELKPYLGTAQDNDFGLQFRTQATTSSGVTTKMTLAPGGSLGVGTTTPNYLLDVEKADAGARINALTGNSSVYLTCADNTGIATLFLGDAASPTTGQIKYRNNGDSLAFEVSGSERIRVTSSGNVGIGTSTANSKLVVQGSDGGNVLHLHGSTGTASRGLRFGLATGTATNDIGVYDAVTSSGQHSFRIAGSEALRIDSSGNVGVGLTPTAKLHVAGTIQSSVGSHTAQMYSDGGASFFTSVGAYPSVFYTNGSERLRIDSSGRVGIGNSSPTQELCVRSTAGTEADILLEGDNGASGGLTVFHNAFDCGLWNSSNTSMRFATNGTERLRIDSSGNVLLGGVASPTSATKSFALFNGTAPTASVTNGVVLYAEDVSASSELKVRDEAGNVTTLSPHNFDLIPDGPSEDMAWSYYSEKDGKRINVDMLKAVRLLEQLTGEKLVFTA